MVKDCIDLNEVDDVKMIAAIKLDEGFRAYPYFDKDPNFNRGNHPLFYEGARGKLTFGYGHNLEEPLPKALAEKILIYDVEQAASLVLNYRACHETILALNRSRRNVIITMFFNMGNKLWGFQGMFLSLSKQEYTMAAKEMLDSLWAKQVGSRATKLANVMEVGVWPDFWGKDRIYEEASEK